MLVQTEANPAETGTNGVNLVAQAEKLEALLWQQVLTCMTQTATPDGALGTGSDLYNGMVTHASPRPWQALPAAGSRKASWAS